VTTVIERDLSLSQAARLSGHSRDTLRAVWSEIPTAYVTESGRCWVSPEGLRQWLYERSENTNAADAPAASVGR